MWFVSFRRLFCGAACKIYVHRCSYYYTYYYYYTVRASFTRGFSTYYIVAIRTRTFFIRLQYCIFRCVPSVYFHIIDTSCARPMPRTHTFMRDIRSCMCSLSLSLSATSSLLSYFIAILYVYTAAAAAVRLYLYGRCFQHDLFYSWVPSPVQKKKKKT